MPTVARHGLAARNAIDAFVLARLEKEKIAPSPEADRVTLIRRLSLDLLGLPPSPQEVDDFVGRQPARRLRAAGGSAAGLAALRRALGPALARPGPLRRLATATRRTPAGRSPGATATGSSTPSTATCRSTSSPSSRLAGDLLPNATIEQKIATGFHRNTLTNHEGGIDLEQFRVEAVVDRVNTTAQVCLGLTLGCCQCHDHKYDPFTQREYYQFFAFFNSDVEANLPGPAAGRDAR